MIDWKIDFSKSQVYFKAENLITKESAAVMDALGITYSPHAALIPISKRYQEQNTFENDKMFLMRRLINCGYPYNGAILRHNGHRSISSPARSVWSGVIFGKSPQGNNSDKMKPSGDCQAVHIELSRVGKVARVPGVSKIVLNGTNEPFIDSTIIITDVWDQKVDFLDTPIMFLTVYAHINGFPNHWYTQLHLFSIDGKFHLFPEPVLACQTIDMTDKNAMKSVFIQVENPELLKMIADGILLVDPIWTTSEDVFEFQAPIWYNRFMKNIPEVIDSFEPTVVKGGNLPVSFMVSKSNVSTMSNVLTSSWVKYPEGKYGYFYGTAINRDNLIYGLFKTWAEGEFYRSTPMWLLREDDLEPTGDADIVFRPGFKKSSGTINPGVNKVFEEATDTTPQPAVRVIQKPEENTQEVPTYQAPEPIQQRFGTSLGDVINTGASTKAITEETDLRDVINLGEVTEVTE